MRKIKMIIFYVFILLFITVANSQAQNVSDYLILHDIGDYKFITQVKDFITGQMKIVPGYIERIAPGILAGADHFDLDHNDITYETDYVNRDIELAVEVQVTQHAGSGSDKWLLHEVEDAYRESSIDKIGLITQGTRMRDINGNKILSLRGSGYSWISNYKNIDISYTDFYGNKPEPLEIIQTYLNKFPSTIPSSLILDKAHDEQWIKDEFDRRLWLCDKWFQHLSEGKTELYDALKEVNDNLEVFLDYREKYYEIDAFDEKKTLSGYLVAKNEEAIRNKLEEYKEWWNENKSKPINLP